MPSDGRVTHAGSTFDDKDPQLEVGIEITWASNGWVGRTSIMDDFDHSCEAMTTEPAESRYAAAILACQQVSTYFKEKERGG